MPITCAVITVSDRSFRGEREDFGGPAITKFLTEAGYEVKKTALVPDEIPHIKKKIIECAQLVDLVVTTGGTGTAKRDVTPEATLVAVERELPGFGEAMRAASLKITPHAILSRATAGLLGRALVINLPGSPKGARENLEAVMAAIPHAIELWQGKKTDCAGTGDRP